MDGRCLSRITSPAAQQIDFIFFFGRRRARMIASQRDRRGRVRANGSLARASHRTRGALSHLWTASARRASRARPPRRSISFSFSDGDSRRKFACGDAGVPTWACSASSSRRIARRAAPCRLHFRFSDGDCRRKIASRGRQACPRGRVRRRALDGSLARASRRTRGGAVTPMDGRCSSRITSPAVHRSASAYPRAIAPRRSISFSFRKETVGARSRRAGDRRAHVGAFGVEL
jgi:hypothetical protein